ncbi:MAG: peptide-methionine (S)-S-oxide reductase MsrA [Candidatus Sericytochromatia bacterium]|nr:peptide-methionine (S)-S-oxide reductase MsrA [Candidatus Sericytochromatia bacterium]
MFLNPFKPKAWRIWLPLLLLLAQLLPAALAQSGVSNQPSGQRESATFAGGCFWCMQPPFDKTPGVLSTTVGYAGGHVNNPSYTQVTAGTTGHAEAIQVLFDPQRVSYSSLLDVFWRQIDPTTPNRQFVDVGNQYRTAIFYHNAAQKAQAEASKKRYDRSGRFGAPIVTEISPVGTFWPAEDYHQQYYLKHPYKYRYYRWNSGRDQYLEKIWGSK